VGGLFITNDSKYAEQLRSLRNLAFGKVRFLHKTPAYNFRLSSMQAAMGIVQTARIEEFIQRKIHLFELYREALAGVPGVRFPKWEPTCRHVHWMVGIRIGADAPFTRDQLKEHLSTSGIDTRTFFCPMNQQPFLVSQPGYRSVACPVADVMWEDGIYLPSTITLAEADVEFIASKVKSCAA